MDTKEMKKKIKIAFHDNQLCERGTTVSLYDYAYYNKYYYNTYYNKLIIIRLIIISIL